MKTIFELHDKEQIEYLLNSIEYCTLALCRDNIPYSIPVNFVYYNGSIYFHGAIKGKKIDFISENSTVAISVVNDLSLIPSFFNTDDGNACPASQFFTSIMIEGEATLVNDLEQRAEVLEALMQKLQPQGGYNTIKVNEQYKKVLKATMVCKVEIKTLSAKIKCAQHKSSEIQKKIMDNLKNRGSSQDEKSLYIMEKFSNK